jgi:hypothetical protein
MSSNQSQNPNPNSGSSSNIEASTNTTVTKKSKSSRPADANYQQKLIDGNVFPYDCELPDDNDPPLPQNWQEIKQRLTKARASLSPSKFPEDDYKKFVKADARAFNEEAIKDTVLPAMLRAIRASDGAQKSILFTNLEPITPGITQAKLDYYYGAKTKQIYLDIRNSLDNTIIPSSHTHLPAALDFFMEAKGPDGSLAEGQR